MNSTSHRSGTILIIVAGISALLASLALTFLVRNQNEANESNAFVQKAQARIMLVAACSYIQESSRIGWDAKNNQSSVHLETYGWIDVRDGFLGPKPFSESPASPIPTTAIRPTPYLLSGSGKDSREQANRTLSSGIPIGEPKRFPMYALKQPPYAIQSRVGYNRINQNSASPDYLQSYLRYPDPQPVTDNNWKQDQNSPGGTVLSTNFASWETGDATPRHQSLGLSWFRLLREPNGSTFLVTCGAGNTMGYRNWSEIQNDPNPEGRTMFPSAEVFRLYIQCETRLWYRVEWSPAIMAIDNHLLWHHGGTDDHYEQFPMNLSVRNGDPWGQLVHHNMGGTIPMIERLRTEPANW